MLATLSRIIIIAVLTLSLGACLAPKTQTVKVDSKELQQEQRLQQEMALQNFNDSYIRLQQVAYPLKRAAHDLCQEDQGYLIGAVLATQYNYSEKFRNTAKDLFQIDESLRIHHLLDESPLLLAGLQQGDQITALNDVELEPGKSVRSEFYKLLKEADARQISLLIQRDAEIISASLPADEGCNYQVKLSESDAVNAYADGSNVVITRGMMRFAETDQELALVVSHEMAHNVMEHIKAKQINSLGGSLLDLAAAIAGVNTQGTFGKIGAMAYSQEFENEADYVGLYIMSRAGMETENAAQFWRRMAVEHPRSINSSHSSTHPSSAERFLAIENTLEEIQQKKVAGQPLVPEMKAE